MTWSIQQQLPGTTATERLAAWTYFKDTFIPGLGGWTKTAAHDDVADGSKFSCQRTIVDLVSGQNRPESHVWINNTFGSSEWTSLQWYPMHLTSTGEVPTDPLFYRLGAVSRTANFSSYTTPADPSYEGFNFCVSDENDQTFLVTYNRRLLAWFLGFQQTYHWADDSQWFSGTRVGYRQAPYERPFMFGDTTASVGMGTEQSVSGSDSIIPGVSFYPIGTQLVDYAWAGFPWLASSVSDTDDDVTTAWGTLPNTDVSWVRPYNFPYGSSTGQNRFLCRNSDQAYQVARALNGDFQIYWRDVSGSPSSPWAMLSFGANDPTV